MRPSRLDPQGTGAAYTARMLPDDRTPAPQVRTSEPPQQYSLHQAALVDVAEGLFAEHGYAATSLDQSWPERRSPRARSTTTSRASRRSSPPSSCGSRGPRAGRSGRPSTAESDPWVKAHAGLQAFLEVVQRPDYRRIVIQDGPSVLDHDRFREQEQRSTFATVDEIVRGVLTDDGRALDEEMLLTLHPDLLRGALLRRRVGGHQ